MIGYEVIEPYSVMLEKSRCSSREEAETVLSSLQGRNLKDIQRKGKYLFLRFEGDKFLIIHLKMTGQLLVDADRALNHERVRLYFSNRVLRFNDMRKFGYIRVADESDAEKIKSRLGPDALDELDENKLKKILQSSSRPIKYLLLDQSRISGIGNAYADEILFRSGIHPLRNASSISGEETGLLYRSIKDVLIEGIEAGGLSMRDYVNAYGFKGGMQNRLQVYRRETLSCFRCGGVIRRLRSGGRSSYYCENCQK